MLGIHARSAHVLNTWGSRLAWLGMLTGAALLAAKWVAVLVSPRPVAAMAAAPAAPRVTLEDALNVFGKVIAATPQTLGLELTGIYAARRNKGFATFSAPGGSRSVAVGEEIQPGLKLVAASARHVTVRGGGGEWRIELKTDTGKNRRPAGVAGK